ncbi:VCBS repeat-containing protein [Actinomadura barringtoniae]|uniref:VCBS repeat-containing protein n=1 Tax=Actinomadura barringtoniae TaxID=1427535 RepID=A0A939PD17_9ACTN|nr:VCBS repeat-containing protein [Actinomadura barringtoniae]MBO2446236.1 VCBS repeat-containing protein [Actinomadura barringtoniae]
MKKRTLGSAAAAALALGGVAALAITQNGGAGQAAQVAQVAAVKPAHRPALPGDFNGDGRRDTVAPDMSAFVDGKWDAGLIAVVYSGPGGPDRRRRQAITANSPGVPGTVRTNGSFGQDIASGDFDRDGYADLVLTTGTRSAPIVIVYGGPRGLTGRTVTLKIPGRLWAGAPAVGDFGGNGALDLVVADEKGFWTFRDIGRKAVKGTRTAVANKGSEYAPKPIAADFNGDHRTDLAMMVGVYGDGDYFDSWGELRLGTAKGLSTKKTRFGKGWLGLAGAAGDVNGDGRADLVVDSAKSAGISVLYGTGTGFGRRQQVGRTLPDGIGALAVGDVNGDRKADVALSTGEENADTGQVQLRYGAKGGLAANAAQTFSLATPGVPHPPRTGKAFGAALTLTDLTGEGLGDLSVGLPAADSDGVGSVVFLHGTRKGVTTAGARGVSGVGLGLGGAKLRAWDLGETLLD